MEDREAMMARFKMRLTYPLLALLFFVPWRLEAQHDMHAMPGMNMQSNAENAKPDEPALKLEELEEMALKNNPSLFQAQSEVRAASGTVRQAGLYPNPTVSYRGDEIRGGAFGGGEQGFLVSQEIVLGGKLGAAVKVARQEKKEAEASMEEQRYRVLNRVRMLFYEELGAEQMVLLRRRMQQLVQDAAQTSHQLANVGQADEPDVLQAEAEADLAALEVITAEQAQRSIWFQLAAAVGKPDLPARRLTGNFEEIPSIDGEEILGKLMRDSPAIRLAQAEVARAEAALTLARRIPIPDLQISAGLQQDAERKDLGRGSVGLIGFAEAGVRIPLFNRNQGDIEAAQAQLERSQRQVERAQLEIRRRFAPLLERYATSRATVESYRQNILPKAQRAYELYRRKYEEMQAAYPQVLISQRTLFQLQANYVQAVEKVWMSSVAIHGFALSDGLSTGMTGEGEVTGSMSPALMH
jgi:outer membrane protein, heavy metal efflux system